MGREGHCPYDTNHEYASHLCEWKAKGAANWMIKSEFSAASSLVGPADHVRGSFHESGQFYTEGKFGDGDDGSFWYEVNKKTTPKRFRVNAELWASQLNSRSKVYRKVNRCGASPSEGCRYVCEEICEHKDPTIFPGFKPDGSVHDSCDHSSSSHDGHQRSSQEEEEEELPKMVEMLRHGGATAAADNDAFRSIARPSSHDKEASPRSASGRGLLEDDVGRRFQGKHAGHRLHRRSSHHTSEPEPAISTPFYQDLKNWGTGYTCYKKCRTTCEGHFNETIEYEPGYKHGYGFEWGSEKRVQCKVAFADVVQYQGAASVEVTGGPKLMRHIKPGRCDAVGPSGTLMLPSSIGQSVKDMITQTPIFSECHCGGLKHLVALSGAHTIGHAHDRLVSDKCQDLMPGSTENAQNFDHTPFTFDNVYFKQLTRASCPNHRVWAKRYDSCTRSYLTEDWVANKPWTEDTSNPLNNVETTWYVKQDGRPIRCSNLTENTMVWNRVPGVSAVSESKARHLPRPKPAEIVLRRRPVTDVL